jgi:hypothetical protein
MGKVTGFLEYQRELPARRPVEERINDWFEIYQEFPNDRVKRQGTRCMESPTTMLPQFVKMLPHRYQRVDQDRINDLFEIYQEFPNGRVRTQDAGCSESPTAMLQRMDVASQPAKGEIIHG